MDKIKKNAILKFFVGIILAVSLMIMLITGIIEAMLIYRGYPTTGKKDDIKEEYFQETANKYSQMAINDYTRLLEEKDKYTDNYFKDNFSEDTCNMAFTIEAYEDKDKYPVVSNYSCEDYQYSNEEYRNIEYNYDNKKFSYSISLEEVNDMLNSDSEEVFEEYEGEYDEEYDEGLYYYYDYSVFENDENEIYINNGESSYILNDNKDFANKYEDFIKDIEKNYTDFYISDMYYDMNSESIQIYYSVCDSVDVVLNYYIKSELTAYDDFYYVENICDFIINFNLLLLIVSIIITLISVIYLTLAAGHIKGKDEISLNRFDKIPYDIVGFVVVSICCACIGMINEMTYAHSFKATVILAFPFVIISMLALVAMYYTTVARIKTNTLFKNTVLYRIWKKFTGLVKYLWSNFSIYWKYLGVFAAIVFMEIIVISADTDIDFTIVCIFFANAFIAAIMAVALINMNKLKEAAKEIASGNINYEVDTDKMLWEFKNHGMHLNAINDGIQAAVEEKMKSERMKTELITNVSHDIKTPLTSIISYVDLLSKEDINNQTALEYIEVLDRQSARLKKLIEDLIDASKASTGNVQVQLEEVDVKVLLEQALGEFYEKLENKGLSAVVSCKTENATAMADGKLLWRIFDNLINNISKYAQDNTRVYIDVEDMIKTFDSARNDVKSSDMDEKSTYLKVTFKNISKEELNISGDELIERFVRGDSSRNTEGSGLGLSIAKSLIELQGGKMEIIVDGDLFKVVLLLLRA